MFYWQEIIDYAFCPMFHYWTKLDKTYWSYAGCLKNAYIQYLTMINNGKTPNLSDLRDLFMSSFRRSIVDSEDISSEKVDKYMQRAIDDTERFYRKYSFLNKHAIARVNYPYSVDVSMNMGENGLVKIPIHMTLDLLYFDNQKVTGNASHKLMHLTGFYDYLYLPSVEMKSILDTHFFREDWSLRHGEPPEKSYTLFEIAKTGKDCTSTMIMPKGEEFADAYKVAYMRLHKIVEAMTSSIYYCRPTSSCQTCKYANKCRIL